MKDYEIVFLKPEKYDDVKKIVEHISMDQIVHINVSKLDSVARQRTVDHISGAAYIKDSKIKQPGDDVFCTIPKGKSFYYEGGEDGGIDLRYDEVEEIKPNYR